MFALYSAAIIYGTIKYENIRYRLLLGYIAGLMCGAASLLFVSYETALLITLFSGLLANAKMIMSPNR